MKRKKVLFEKRSTDGHFIVGEVYYNMGGMNYFQGVNMARGYYLSVSPEKRSTFPGGTTRIFSAFSGSAKCIKEAARFSQKELDAVTPSGDDVASMLTHVLTKNKLTLAE